MAYPPNEILNTVRWELDRSGPSFTAHFDKNVRPVDSSAPLFAASKRSGEIAAANGLAEIFLRWLEERGFRDIKIEYKKDGLPIIVFSGPKFIDLFTIDELRESTLLAMMTAHVHSATPARPSSSAIRREERIREGDATAGEEWAAARVDTSTTPSRS